MELSTFGQGHINYKVISLFKKYFWKVFLDNKDEPKTDTKEEEPKKSPIKLDEKIVVPATEAIEDVSMSISSPILKKKHTIKIRPKLKLAESSDDKVVPEKPISSPMRKKRKTIKIRPKLILVESSDDKVVPEKPIDTNAEKIFNPLTNRPVKNVSVNRKKIEKQTLKRGGKSKKKTRKNKGNKY
tara:strand:+ start:11 stop:565 length:555 start_codon:yes stop_codon:yes gene_type:complete